MYWFVQYLLTVHDQAASWQGSGGAAGLSFTTRYDDETGQTYYTVFNTLNVFHFKCLKRRFANRCVFDLHLSDGTKNYQHQMLGDCRHQQLFRRQGGRPTA